MSGAINFLVAVQPNVFPHRCSVHLISDLSNARRLIYYSHSKQRFVLRKKPAGTLLSATAHQIEREYTMLHALHKYNSDPSTHPKRKVPVPGPIVLCEDTNIIGTPFYIMEFLDGRIFTDTRVLEIPPEDRREW